MAVRAIHRQRSRRHTTLRGAAVRAQRRQLPFRDDAQTHGTYRTILSQYVLVASSIGLLVLFLRRRGSTRTAAGTKLAFVLFLLFGIYAALPPSAYPRV